MSARQSAEYDVGALGDLIARHDAYHVNEDGWTVCICGHVAEGDDDDGSHARHVAAVIATSVIPPGNGATETA